MARALRLRKRLGLLAALSAAVCALAPASATASTAMCNVPIKMSDGIVLRANLWLPSPAAGTYPTVLTATGYNKDTTNPAGTACSGSGGIAMADTSLADRGYAVMISTTAAPARARASGTRGASAPRTTTRRSCDWIQAQGWSNGSVATTGGSYMGITSLLIAEADAARVSRASRAR